MTDYREAYEEACDELRKRVVELDNVEAQIEAGYAAIRKVARIQQLLSLAPRTARGISIDALFEALQGDRAVTCASTAAQRAAAYDALIPSGDYNDD